MALANNPTPSEVVKEVKRLDTAKQNTLTAGSGITISGDTISATGTTIPIDSALSDSSVNPVQNKVVKAAIDAKANKIATNTDTGYTTEIINTEDGVLLASYDAASQELASESAMIGATVSNVAAISQNTSGAIAQILADYNSGVNLTALDENSTGVVNVTSTEISAQVVDGGSVNIDANGVSITGTTVTINGTDINNKMDKANPTGTGSLSLNRRADTTIGTYSVAEGIGSAASGYASHAEGIGSKASGQGSHAEGWIAIASGDNSHAEGRGSTASGDSSHAEGFGTTAQRRSQHTFGEYNILDTSGTTTTRGNYVEIVGNGTASNATSNARTLDWAGNEWLAGSQTATSFIKTGGTSSQFLKADGSVDNNTYLTSFTETDPTVPSWAKQATKPTYTASEVGALPSNTTYVSSVNGATGAITNVAKTNANNNFSTSQTITGTVTATTFNATSDRRLKKNIKAYKPKSSILDLPIKQFDYKVTGEHSIGCLAQDLQKICPEIVKRGDDGYLSIEESKIVYLLLKEVKELKEELIKLKEK